MMDASVIGNCESHDYGGCVHTSDTYGSEYYDQPQLYSAGWHGCSGYGGVTTCSDQSLNQQYVSVICPANQVWWMVNGSEICVGFGDQYFYKPKEEICIPCLLTNPNLDSNPSFGNPIYPLTGSRRQDVDLGLMVGGQSIKLTYDTIEQTPEVNGGSTWLVPPPPSFGALWQSNLNKNLVLQSTGSVGDPYSTVALQRGGMTKETANVAGFDSCGGTGGGGSPIYTPPANPNSTLQFTGTGSAGTLVDGSRLTEETYDASGAITGTFPATGGQLNFSYANGLLTNVTDQFGRGVQFAYEQPSDVTLAQRVNLITATDGSTINVTYDLANNLHALTWTDGQTRTFVYENVAFAWALTGIIDENGARFSTYGYDAQGRANSTYLGNGANNYSVTYAAPPQWAVTQTLTGSNFLCREHRWQPPQGAQVTTPTNALNGVDSAIANNLMVTTGQTQSAGSGSPSSSTAMTYDANGNLASFDDPNGNRICFSYDVGRGLPLVTLEGLPGGSSGKVCPVNLAAYAPSAADAQHPERKTTTAWHPNWVLKVREARPKSITTWVYNGQPDPIGGGTASCAPTAPALPDGKPIAVVCSRYEQATTDATGALGVSATVTGVARKWSYTYNQFGQVLTETAPKQSATDSLSHTTTYAYYADTSITSNVGHTIGDLQSVTNPLGQVTTFTSYDGAGRLLSSTDANGAVTTQTYWPRGWIKTQTLAPVVGAAQTTSYAYYPTGLLQTVTMPDNSMLNYAYDDAHRLTDVTDAAGNKIHYVLDNVGNRTSEQVTDASGNLASTVSRVFDALNRVQTQTGLIQ